MKKLLFFIILIMISSSATFAERRDITLDLYDPSDPTNPFAEQPIRLHDSSYKSAAEVWIEFQKKEIQKKEAAYQANKNSQKTIKLMIRYFFITLAILFIAAGIVYHTVIANGGLHLFKKPQPH